MPPSPPKEPSLTGWSAFFARHAPSDLVVGALLLSLAITAHASLALAGFLGAAAIYYFVRRPAARVGGESTRGLVIGCAVTLVLFFGALAICAIQHPPPGTR